MTFTKYLRYSKWFGKSLKAIKLVLFYIFESVQLTLTENQISNNESFLTLSYRILKNSRSGMKN